ncbi:MAG: bacitracin resistance protein BacA [Chitinivibrionales bacterium]|nr:bacitracin resistance protein BacA [Chitinivibrionales bacterium]
MQRELYTPASGPPQGVAPSREIYAAMGADNIYAMCADFYTELERSAIRPLFPADMPAASRKTAEFLMGIIGGPPIYAQKYGPPRMRARHLKFAIDEPARQVSGWVAL